MADIFELLKRKAQEQYAQGQPYRDLFFKGDPRGVLAKLEAWKNLPMDERVTQATDIGMGFAGTMKGVGKTPFEMAHKIAQKNAALPVEKGGLGLPKNNTAMDRAKAMGFDVTNPVYHGTNADITAFNPALSDTARKTGTPSGAFVVTSNPATANTYGMDFVGDFTTTYKPNANVLPLYIRKGKNLSMNATQDGYTPNWNDIFNPKYPNIETTNEFAELAKSKGKESATIKNVKDNARISSAEGNTTFLFNPNQLRSINAAFDPFRRNEADILAGLLAVPATQLLEDDEDKKKRKTK